MFFLTGENPFTFIQQTGHRCLNTLRIEATQHNAIIAL